MSNLARVGRGEKLLPVTLTFTLWPWPSWPWHLRPWPCDLGNGKNSHFWSCDLDTYDLDPCDLDLGPLFLIAGWKCKQCPEMCGTGSSQGDLIMQNLGFLMTKIPGTMSTDTHNLELSTDRVICMFRSEKHIMNSRSWKFFHLLR